MHESTINTLITKFIRAVNTNRRHNLYSVTWKTTYGDKEAIIIEKPYTRQRISEIAAFYEENRTKLDRYFPPLFDVDVEHRRFIFEYIHARPLMSWFSLRNLLTYPHLLRLVRSAGQKLACLHNENIRPPSGSNLLDEAKILLKNPRGYFRDHFITDEARQAVLSGIEKLRLDTAYIHRDHVPWNILVTDDKRLWYIDYFNSCSGSRYQDISQFVIVVSLFQFDLFPPPLARMVIREFLQGYQRCAEINQRDFLLARIVHRTQFLVEMLDRPVSINTTLKRTYLKKTLKNELRFYLQST